MWLFDLLGEVWDALASIDDGADPKPRILRRVNYMWIKLI